MPNNSNIRHSLEIEELGMKREKLKSKLIFDNFEDNDNAYSLEIKLFLSESFRFESLFSLDRLNDKELKLSFEI